MLRAIVTVMAGSSLVLAAVSPTSALQSPATDITAPVVTLADYVEGVQGSDNWIPETGVSEDAWDSALDDETVRVGPSGRVFIADAPVDTAEPQPTAPLASARNYSYSTVLPADVFALSSNPGADTTIYLDFTGYTDPGSGWQADYESWAADQQVDPGAYDPTFSAFSLDGDSANFSLTERTAIYDAWRNVVEDYAPFTVNVTTVEPTADQLHRYTVSDTTFGVRLVVTDMNNSVYDLCEGCGGVAYLGPFDNLADPVQPGSPTHENLYGVGFAFVGPGASFKIVSDIAGHEVGHTLGLSHDGLRVTPFQEYYMGAGTWAPIMGAGYNRATTQWSKGDYEHASNTEDDIAIIRSHGLVLWGDAVGDTASGAEELVLDTDRASLIATRTDVDVYTFVATAPTVQFDIQGAAPNPNLDIRVVLRDASTTALAAHNPGVANVSSTEVTGLDVHATYGVVVGERYYLYVSGEGVSGDAGYSDYGSLGEYTVTTTSSATDYFPGDNVVSAASSTGRMSVGSTLFLGLAGWGESTDYLYTWLRDGVAIKSGSRTYTVTTADLGHRIQARVSARSSLSNSVVMVRASAPLTVVAGAISPAPTPRISGTTRVGSRLTAVRGTWMSGVTFRYVWWRDFTVISGATGSTYTLKSADAGRRIRVTVVGTKTGYNTMKKTSAFTATIAR